MGNLPEILTRTFWATTDINKKKETGFGAKYLHGSSDFAAFPGLCDTAGVHLDYVDKLSEC